MHERDIRQSAGEIVQVHGWVRIPEPIKGGVDGLLVFDSLGGPALARRIAHTSGWQEFTMYRAATETGQLTVTFALAGFGDAWIDNVSVRPVAKDAVAASDEQRRPVP